MNTENQPIMSYDNTVFAVLNGLMQHGDYHCYDNVPEMLEAWQHNEPSGELYVTGWHLHDDAGQHDAMLFCIEHLEDLERLYHENYEGYKVFVGELITARCDELHKREQRAIELHLIH